jgi:hypothetical protein
MANRGESADYYNNNAPQQGYQMNDQPKYAPQQSPQYNQDNYAPPPGPPNGQYAPPPGPPQQGYGQQVPGYGNEKPTFEEAFKIQKPKYNDLWAGVLFIAVFLGFAAVSGIAINGYGEFNPCMAIIMLDRAWMYAGHDANI